MANRRVLQIGGLAFAAGAGYYLYQSGGNPKVAEKKFEHDAAKLSSRAKSELPGKEKELKTGAKLGAEEAGQKIDQLVDRARAETHKFDQKVEGFRQNAEKNIESYKQEAGKNLSSAIDKFDHKVEEGAAKSKSWVSGWFGGK